MTFALNELILDSQQYSFSHYKHKGFGGINKYIAAPNDNKDSKLLIKYKGEFSPPYNSFVYGRIGQLIGVSVPKIYLMNVVDKDRHLFDTDCVVGMEFIDGALPLNISEIKQDSKLTQDFINCFILCGLFTTFEDSMQCIYLPNNAVYPIDFDESFDLNNALFRIILQNNQTSEEIARDRIKRSACRGLDSYMKVCIEVSAEALGLSIKDVTPIVINTLDRFCKLNDNEIESVTNALMEFFPPILSVYYEEYISMLQRKAIKYIKSMEVL